MPGRLNTFQKSMVQWNEMHPYNAIHVVRVRGAVNPARLQNEVNSTLRRHGLSRLTLNCDRATFQYEAAASDCEVRFLGGDEGSLGVLIAEMERELNAPFDHRQPFSPFRFLVAPADGSFFLGLVYFHPVADAESIVCLLKDIVATYLELPAPSWSGALDLYPDSRSHLLRRRPLVVAHKLLAMPAQMRNLRQSYRARYRDADDMANGFVFFAVGADDLGSLIAAGKRWRVTVNDLLLALLMKCLSPCASARARGRKRRKISVGCIVNVRQDLGVESRRTFGLFLGSFAVTHDVPEGIGLRQLAGDIQQQTSLFKRRKLPLATPLDLGIARLMLGFFSPERRRRFYAKHYPLWGGLTNMNLNSLWKPGEGNEPLDYFRGVSTGPVTPLVLSATTVGDRVNIGLSYRKTVFSRSDVDDLQCRFREHLQEARRAA